MSLTLDRFGRHAPGSKFELARQNTVALRELASNQWQTISKASFSWLPNELLVKTDTAWERVDELPISSTNLIKQSKVLCEEWPTDGFASFSGVIQMQTRPTDEEAKSANIQLLTSRPERLSLLTIHAANKSASSKLRIHSRLSMNSDQIRETGRACHATIVCNHFAAAYSANNPAGPVIASEVSFPIKFAASYSGWLTMMNERATSGSTRTGLPVAIFTKANSDSPSATRVPSDKVKRYTRFEVTLLIDATQVLNRQT